MSRGMPKWVYHGTSRASLPSIREKGLTPSVPGDKLEWGNRPVVFFVLEEDLSPVSGGKRLTKLRFPFPEDGILPFKWRNAFHWVTYKTIPPEEIEVYEDGKWMPLVQKNPLVGKYYLCDYCGIVRGRLCEDCDCTVCADCIDTKDHRREDAQVAAEYAQIEADRKKNPKNEWADEQPGWGDIVIHCGHKKLEHWFKCQPRLRFGRPNGTTGYAKWLVCCENCLDKADGEPTAVEIRGDMSWKSDEPVIKAQQKNPARSFKCEGAKNCKRPGIPSACKCGQVLALCKVCAFDCVCAKCNKRFIP